MYQFFNGSDGAFAELRRRAAGRCVQYAGQELPPGTTPGRARVGFQVDAATGSATLFVERGIAYRGQSPAIRRWLETGEMHFANFDELRRWIREELGIAYPPSTPGEPSPPIPSHSPESLTDLAAVREQMPDPGRPLHVQEESLFAELSKSVRGQEGPLRLLARRVCQHIARRAPRRPATLLAIGPTGVGKTKAAESLPQTLRTLVPGGAGYNYLRLDMGEYRESHRVSQLLGAPPGYVGYGDGAQLADALAANPRTIVLFDEIEKAHPDVLRTLMNAMDAGRLSVPGRSSRGRELDCRQAIFLFTSNLDSEGILEELEERDAFGNAVVEDTICRNHFRVAGLAPELVGRISCFLVFRPLSNDTRAEIIALAVTRVAREYGLRVERIAPAVILAVLKQARGEGFGARPDEYLVGDLLGDCFARAVTEGMSRPVEVCGGPPFRCILLQVPLAEDSD